MIVTYGLILTPTIFFIINIAVVLHVAVVVLSALSLAAVLLFYSFTACSDPGMVYKEDFHVDVESPRPGASGVNRNVGGLTECGQCQITRPHEAAHCYECGHCVNEVSQY